MSALVSMATCLGLDAQVTVVNNLRLSIYNMNCDCVICAKAIPWHFVVDAPESDKRDLLSDLEVMKHLRTHPHVIKLLGSVTESGKLIK